MENEDRSWAQTKLSLERPYKDDSGQPIQTLLDINPDGTQIYEPVKDWSSKLGDRFRRIFAERGTDFFEKDLTLDANEEDSHPAKEPDKLLADASDEKEEKEETGTKYMSPEMLFKLRTEVVPRLHIALGEMTLAHDMLAVLLSATLPNEPPPIPNIPAGSLSTTTVSRLPDIPSVQAFNAQLAVGGKDQALRDASSVLKTASEKMDRGIEQNSKYWADALRIRRSNWNLLPAPLPFGAHTSKSVDKTTRDFLVYFGLEESPVLFRQRAVGHLSDNIASAPGKLSIVFPQRRNTELLVSILVKDGSGGVSTSRRRLKFSDTDESLDKAIGCAQREVIEQEIFAALIHEAGNLPSASTRVSERLIVVEAAQEFELRFELVDSEDAEGSVDAQGAESAVCDLIYSALQILLLRSHSYTKAVRLNIAGLTRFPRLRNTDALPILQPIIDMLQYRVFCNRIRNEFSQTLGALSMAGVSARLRFDPVGGDVNQLVKALVEPHPLFVSGEAVIRIDDRQSLRFTFTAPSSLVAHLPQATLTVTSIPQLSQLLVDEVERGLLGRICEIGMEACEYVGGTWFVDEMMCRSIGRWEGCVLNFRVKCRTKYEVDCISNCLTRKDRQPTPTVSTYSARDDKSLSLFAWARKVINDILVS